MTGWVKLFTLPRPHFTSSHVTRHSVPTSPFLVNILTNATGTIQAGWNFLPDSPSLSNLTKEMLAARAALDLSEFPLTPLPIGVGFIICHPSFFSSFEKGILPILQEHSPQAVWLFAPDPAFVTEGKVKDVIERLHDSGFMTLYQVGTVAAARQAVRDGTDIIVAQGVDAGGHQFVNGAGIVSLVPEVVEMVEREFPGREVVVVAAGGISDGRGVAGALALGEFIVLVSCHWDWG